MSEYQKLKAILDELENTERLRQEAFKDETKDLRQRVKEAFNRERGDEIGIHIGDMLLITHSFRYLKQDELTKSKVIDETYALGNEIQLKDFLQLDAYVGVPQGGIPYAWGTSCTIEVLKDMRAAWLEREGSTV